MTAHSILPPSSAGVWGAPAGCRGWVYMDQAFPELEPDPTAEEGDAAHELAARMIAAGLRAQELSPTQEVGATAPNGVIVTGAMWDGAELYADDVLAVARGRRIFGGPSLGIEERLSIPEIHGQCFGTPDCFLFDSTSMELFIWDFKFGYSVVEAFENWQAIAYIAGLITRFDWTGLDDQAIKVRIRIVQPRAPHHRGPVREWRVKLSDLRGYINQLRSAAELIMAGDMPFNSGAHCRYCPGRHSCPAATQAGVQLYEAATGPHPLDLDSAGTGLQLLIVRRAIEQLKALESGYEAELEAAARSGKSTPGWMTVDTYGRETWAVPTEEVLNLGALLGQDLSKPGVLTPNQTRKLGVDASIVAPYTHKPHRGVKLVPDDGTRAREVFSQ